MVPGYNCQPLEQLALVSTHSCRKRYAHSKKVRATVVPSTAQLLLACIMLRRVGTLMFAAQCASTVEAVHTGWRSTSKPASFSLQDVGKLLAKARNLKSLYMSRGLTDA